MNYFDIIFAVPLLWGAYKGFTKGLIVSIASMLALLVGVYGAIRFSGFVGEYISGTINVQENYVPLIAFAVTFIGIVIGIHFLAKMISKLIDAIALGWLNKIAGILFGMLKSIFIMSIFIFIVDKVDPNSNFISKDIKEESLLYEPIKILAPAIFPSLNNVHLDPKIPTNIIPDFPV